MKKIQCTAAVLAVSALLTVGAGAVTPGVGGIWMGAYAVEWFRQMLPPSTTPTNTNELRQILKSSIEDAAQPPVLDVSRLDLGENPSITVKNVYHSLLADFPQLKYAYDLIASVENNLLTCQVAYMPYKTGGFPAGFQGVTVSSLEELIAAAQAGLGGNPVPVRITNPALLPDDLNLALQQVGGGEILCQLNGPELKSCISPPQDAPWPSVWSNWRTLKEVTRLVRPGMSQLEIATVLYDSLTEQVVYDRRYYTAPATLPYSTRTAYGALHDRLAICGGYALAYQLLLQTAGIPCYTVSGTAGGEAHMWNVALIDGQWRYADPTWDRGTKRFGYRYFHTTAEELQGQRHQWDIQFTARLTGAAQEEPK